MDRTSHPLATTAAPITAFSQQAPAWRLLHLGTGRPTIGEAGCLISAIASALVDLGVDTDPGRLNAWLTGNHGFWNDNLLIWKAVEGLGVELTDIIRCESTPAPLPTITTALATGRAVLVKLDWRPGGALNQHWVRMTQCDPQPANCQVMDPWQARGQELISLERYALPGWGTAQVIFGIAIYARATRAPVSGGKLQIDRD